MVGQGACVLLSAKWGPRVCGCVLNGSLLYNRLRKWEADGSVSGTWVPLSEREKDRQTGRRYKGVEVGQGRVSTVSGAVRGVFTSVSSL